MLIPSGARYVVLAAFLLLSVPGVAHGEQREGAARSSARPRAQTWEGIVQAHPVGVPTGMADPRLPTSRSESPPEVLIRDFPELEDEVSRPRVVRWPIFAGLGVFAGGYAWSAYSAATILDEADTPQERWKGSVMFAPVVGPWLALSAVQRPYCGSWSIFCDPGLSETLERTVLVLLGAVQLVGVGGTVAGAVIYSKTSAAAESAKAAPFHLSAVPTRGGAFGSFGMSF